jgi:mannose-6-phosphate isomerase
MNKIAALQGSVKHYDWGGFDFIPALLELDNEGRQPYAEYWLGVHPQANTQLLSANDQPVLLSAIIQQDPAGTIGEKVNQDFGTVPYLLKLLDVKDMLSIQVHPSKAAAAAAFEQENKDGVALTAPNRNYKDKNHKPELMVAMSEFWLLHGFKPEKELTDILQQTPELNFLLPYFEEGGYAGLYRHVMSMPQEAVNKALAPLAARIQPLYEQNQLQKQQEDFWAARAMQTFKSDKGIDRGIFSVYLFNVVHMQSGEAIFQDAGVPHAYLEGQNVEIMASSDNVLRGGLTTKHIDVPELLKHTLCQATYPHILKGEQVAEETVFKTPAADFELGYFTLKPGQELDYTSVTTDILLLTSGKVTISDGMNTVQLHTAQLAGVVFANTRVTIKAATDAMLFRATVPV